MTAVIAMIIITTLLIISTTAHAKTFTQAETRATVKRAAKHYGVSPAWITNAAIDIIYTGAHESSGAERAKNGDCVGILQFNGSWHATATTRRLARKHHHPVSAWRTCGTCSLYRYVKSYKDGGKPAIRRHWRATLGR